MNRVTEMKSRIQLNDKYADVPAVTDYVAEERRRMSAEDAPNMTVSIKADRTTDMGTVSDVKLALRRAGATKISYSAVSKRNK